jgi:hypothetical protein
MLPTGAATFGDLRRDSKWLEIGCTACGHHAYVNPRDLPFTDHELVPALYQRNPPTTDHAGSCPR